MNKVKPNINKINPFTSTAKSITFNDEMLLLFNIKTKSRFEHIFNILKLVANEKSNSVINRNQYMKTILDTLEHDKIINHQMKLLFIQKIINTKNKPVNKNRLQHLNYTRINKYVNQKSGDINKLYQRRNGNIILHKLEDEKSKEIIGNINIFFKRVCNLLKEKKLTRLNYNNLVSNVVPFAANKRYLKSMYNYIITQPVYKSVCFYVNIYNKNKVKEITKQKRKRKRNNFIGAKNT